jgi:UDP-N-acetylglucosamine 2-epimerase (non-hydrolysing)
MKVMIIVGARPNFMKAAPIIGAIRAYNAAAAERAAIPGGNGVPQTVQHVLVHTGQHYDAIMSDAFFADLGLPAPDYNLGVGSGSHAAQTANIMREFESVLLKERPDVLIVVGDVNSTLACSLVAAKISFDASGRRPLIAHVEAGLRSFDRNMPEEINRILTDRLSDLLFTTEESAGENLSTEGIPPDRVRFVGNTMIDSLLTCAGRARESPVLARLGLRKAGPGDGPQGSARPYALLTLHRPSNVDNQRTFRDILEGVSELAGEMAIVFPVHPRTRARIAEMGLRPHFAASNGGAAGDCSLTGLLMTGPLGYLDFIALMTNSRLVITDSGGIQEETSALHIPCVTVRENTERPVTLRQGTNVLAGVTPADIRNAIRRQLARSFSAAAPQYWDGKAGTRIVDALVACSR